MKNIHIEKNTTIGKWNAILIRAIALVVALLLCGVIIVAIAGDISLPEAYRLMLKGTFGEFGNPTSMEIKCWDSGIYAAKLLVIAVALAPAFKMKFWNIGAEGQVVIGGMAAAFIMKNYTSLPSPVLFFCMFVASIVAGAVWGLIPAIFKAKWGTNETLFTLMMNYIAMKIMDYFYNLWRGTASALDAINRTTKIGHLPSVFGQGVAINIIVFVLIAIGMYVYLRKSKQGYEIAVVGDSPNTARYAGINVRKVIIRTMIISGAVCGLCGGMTVAGQTYNIASATVAGGYGFTAIIVCWLAKFNTITMIPISILIIFLEKGTAQLGNTYSALQAGVGDVLIGIVLFFIIACEFFINYKIVVNKEDKEVTA